ncbi:prostaglandin E2 receptor EP4 subtype-like [Saccostrea cucullata]|uniref:prostaglandin E2 receptor EP4 subtype-like n=1 Tax=Saccostrea cuccullata TaxID=36930 RepID=UPI002ED2DB54
MASNQTTSNPDWPSPAPVSLLFIVGVVGNALALFILFSSYKTHKWRPFYRYVAGLAVTDSCGVFLTCPFVILRYASGFQYDFPDPLCDFIAFILMFMILGSAFIVCAMSLDRFLAILYPHIYNTATKNRRATLTLLGIWTFSGFISSLHIITKSESVRFFPGTWCFHDFLDVATKGRVLTMLYSLIGILILVTTAVLNALVICSFCRNIRQKRKKTMKRDIFIIIFLILTVIVFSICISPLLIVMFCHAIGTISGDGKLERIALRISFTNAIIDPWIYIVFRKETVEFLLRRVCKCCLVLYPDTEDSTRSSTKQPEMSVTKTSQDGENVR